MDTQKQIGTEPKKKSNKKAIWIIAICLIVPVVLLCLGMLPVLIAGLMWLFDTIFETVMTWIYNLVS